MPFEKGNTHGKGRPKGAKNKQPVEIKKAIEEALALAGGKVIEDVPALKGVNPATAYMLKLAETQPAIFAGLVKPLLPTKVDIDVTVMTNELVTMLADGRQRVKEIEHKEDDND